MPACRPLLTLALLVPLVALPITLTPAQPVTQPETEPETQPQDARSARAQRAKRRLLERAQAMVRAEQARARVDVIREQVNWLANPARGGRAPDTPGIAQAADHIEKFFTELGLEPAFPTEISTPDGSIVITPNATYRQPFTVGEKIETIESRLSVVLPDGTIETASGDLEVSIYSSTSAFSGPVAFVGYSIVAGGGDYLGYTGLEDLKDKAVIMLSHEPMDELGRSLWSDQGWSFAAPLHRKINAAVRRGAKAVLVVDPPDLNEALTGSPDPQGQSRAEITPFEVPVVHIPSELADSILRAGDPEHRTLERLYEQANREGTVVDLPGVTVAVQTAVDIQPSITSNIGAILPGRGELADQYIVIGAHYDHLGLGNNGSRDPENLGQVHPGADDNASGTAGLLTAAADLTQRYDTLPDNQNARSILFLAFNAEERGLVGSRFYVEHPVIPIDDHVLMLNLDMVGRYASGDGLQIGGFHSSPDLLPIVEPMVLTAAIRTAPIDPTTGGRSDHASFNDKGVPNLFFFTGFHDQYHTIHDTPDLIDAEGIARIASLTSDIALEVATAPERLAFDRDNSPGSPTTEPEEDEQSEKVRVGLVPAVRSSGTGMLVKRVSPDSSAEEGGLKPGDRITAWNGQPVDSINTWMELLANDKPGDRVTVEYRRAGETKTTELVLQGQGDDE
jgi:peptidase M28-like protein/PDZ domain-containing protein